MNRRQYLAARRLLRENGRAALRWMDEATRAVFWRLLEQNDDPYDEVLFFQRRCSPTTYSFLQFRYSAIPVAR